MIKFDLQLFSPSGTLNIYSADGQTLLYTGDWWNSVKYMETSSSKGIYVKEASEILLFDVSSYDGISQSIGGTPATNGQVFNYAGDELNLYVLEETPTPSVTNLTRLGTITPTFKLGSSDVDKMYFGSTLIYASAPKLDTPTNLSISDTTLTFTPVENAETYEVFADGVSIGEVSALQGNLLLTSNDEVLQDKNENNLEIKEN